jgi:hypothetical protein
MNRLRQTFTIAPPNLPADDPALRDYANGFIEALSALFTPDFGPERLLPPEAPGHFLIDLGFHHVGTEASVAVALFDAETRERLASRTLNESMQQALDPQRVEIMRIDADLRSAALERELTTSEAQPAAERDARDLVIMWRHGLRIKNPDQKMYVDLLEQARRLAPDDWHVLVEWAWDMEGRAGLSGGRRRSRSRRGARNRRTRARAQSAQSTRAASPCRGQYPPGAVGGRDCGHGSRTRGLAQ